MSRRAVKYLLPLALILFVPVAALAQTADDVITKHIAALGGREALGKLTSRKSTGTVIFVTPAGELSGPFENYYKAPNKSRAYMRIDASALGAGEMVVEQRFDGVNGYLLNSLQGDSEMSGNQLDNFRNGSFPSNLLIYKQAGVNAELLPKEKIADKDMIVLRLTPKIGSAVKMYFDPVTYLVARTVTTVNSPQMGGDIEQTSEPSDYRVVDGVKVPFQIVNSNPVQTIKIKITKVEHNIPLDDAMFGKK